ncbi:energy transducer TonB [Limnobacter humi]|uniref:Protein TonB n=1 Tax=Limnobacter humi TaxID=1778671 RepID=A0ABT1WIY6_9BURK|nr:energy transducer TonB [Limnobacter humi]MCQ8896692.1 energy transducer TonB [Limnobacter humi]
MRFALPEKTMPPAHQAEPPQALILGSVVLVHLLVLLWVGRQVHIAQPTLTQPSVEGVLIAIEPAPKASATPQPAPPKDVVKPKPAAKPVKQEQPKPSTPAIAPAIAPEPAPLTAATAPAQPQAQAVSPSAPPQDTQTITPPRTDAAHLNNPPPAYPALSRRLGEQGRVLVDVYILPDGSVGDLKLNKSSGFGRLDDAAMTAVKQWKFVPAKRGGQPIAFWYVQPVSFVLNSH